jgi:hypothetical protein
MSDHDALTLVSAVSTWVVAFWCWSAVILNVLSMLKRGGSRLAPFVFHELRPFYLPAVAAQFAADTLLSNPSLGWRVLLAALNLLNWFLLKDAGGDDDRWKRRKAKLAEKVSQVGGRLVVEPAGAES